MFIPTKEKPVPSLAPVRPVCQILLELTTFSCLLKRFVIDEHFSVSYLKLTGFPDGVEIEAGDGSTGLGMGPGREPGAGSSPAIFPAVLAI